MTPKAEREFDRQASLAIWWVIVVLMTAVVVALSFAALWEM